MARLAGAGNRRFVEAGGGGVVTLSGELFIFASDFDIVGPWDTVSGIRVNTDGTIDKYTATNDAPGAYTQIDASTDWIIPNGAASSDYQFRLDVNSGTPNFNSDSTATWLAITGEREWYVRRTTQGSSTWNWTLRVRLGTGAEIDSATYTGESTNNPF